jgi:hypothetical protein
MVAIRKLVSLGFLICVTGGRGLSAIEAAIEQSLLPTLGADCMEKDGDLQIARLIVLWQCFVYINQRSKQSSVIRKKSRMMHCISKPETDYRPRLGAARKSMKVFVRIHDKTSRARRGMMMIKPRFRPKEAQGRLVTKTTVSPAEGP